MESELKLWLDYSPKAGEPQPTDADLANLYSALLQVIPGERVEHSEYGYIGIVDCSPADIASANTVSRDLRIPIISKLEERLSRSQLQQVRLAALAIEGDFVDNDCDGNPLNRFPSLLCQGCRMPDESQLPSPFYVSAKQMCRRSQDGVPGERLQRNREVFWCSCGVVVVSERLKRILDVLGQPVESTPVAGTPPKDVAAGFQALRPAHTWGRRHNAVLSVPCPRCGRAQRCHIDSDEGPEARYANRVVVDEDSLPEFDLVCSDTWFGDRTKRASESADFIRDIYVSGRLYELLLRARVRGLMPPEKVVAFSDKIPMAEPLAAQSWASAKLKLLQEEGLL